MRPSDNGGREGAGHDQGPGRGCPRALGAGLQLLVLHCSLQRLRVSFCLCQSRPGIPAQGRPRQEDHSFQASLGLQVKRAGLRLSRRAPAWLCEAHSVPSAAKKRKSLKAPCGRLLTLARPQPLPSRVLRYVMIQNTFQRPPGDSGATENTDRLWGLILPPAHGRVGSCAWTGPSQTETVPSPAPAQRLPGATCL